MSRFKQSSVAVVVSLLSLSLNWCGTSSLAEDELKKIPNEFFILNEDGTGWKSLFLFEGRQANGSVSVSPDGKTIAFDSWPGTRLRDSEIYVKDLEGGEPRLICKGLMPTWSMDGLFLTCSRYEPARGIWLVEIEGEDREYICPGWGAQWSPDGRRIAFGEGPEVKLYDIVKDEFQTILNKQESPYNRVFFNMTWSPGNDRLCLKGVKSDGTEEIATLTFADGKSTLKIHHSGTVEVHPDFAWHPKGDRIICALFCPNRGVTQLYEFNPDKPDSPKLVKGQDETRNNTDIAWTPDGKKLIVVSGDF